MVEDYENYLLMAGMAHTTQKCVMILSRLCEWIDRDDNHHDNTKKEIPLTETGTIIIIPLMAEVIAMTTYQHFLKSQTTAIPLMSRKLLLLRICLRSRYLFVIQYRIFLIRQRMPRHNLTHFLLLSIQ